MSVSSLAIFIILTVVSARVALMSQDSPVNSTYMANFFHSVSGGLRFSEENGYVKVDILISGLPSQDGVYLYFISQGSISSPADCDNALLNPYGGKIDAVSWDLSAVGDLSGKHGKMKGYMHQATYIDPFLSLNPENKAFIGRLAVIVQSMDGQRIACANILKVETNLSNQEEESQTRQIQDRSIRQSKRYPSEDAGVANQQRKVQTDSVLGSYYRNSFPFTLSKNSTMDDFLTNNKYYVDLIRHNHGSVVFDVNSKGQSPHTFWIGCSDSRSGESSLATLPGEIFTHRNIANIVSKNDKAIQGAIEFATDTLKVRRIIVCGHTDCGGVKAALFDTYLGAVLDEWISPIKRVRARNGVLLSHLGSRDEERSKKLAELNVIASINVLMNHPSVSRALEKGSIEIWGMLYDVGSGKLSEVKIIQ